MFHEFVAQELTSTAPYWAWMHAKALQEVSTSPISVSQAQKNVSAVLKSWILARVSNWGVHNL